MSSTAPSRIEIPARLTDKLASFRMALLEHCLRNLIAMAVCASLAGLIVLGISDRFIETPVWVRMILVLGVTAAVAVGILQMVRAAWHCRSPMRTARAISDREPAIGDHLIGALELAVSKSEQARSSSLCVAALEQVADEAARHDFHDALPPSRRALLVRASLSMALVVAVVAVLVPELAINVARRLVVPGSSLPRYTFVTIGPLPEVLVVPRDESVDWDVSLDPTGTWTPETAKLKIGDRKLDATRTPATPRTPATGRAVAEQGSASSDSDASRLSPSAAYRFQVPRLIAPVDAGLRIGDAFERIRIEPRLRPNVTGIDARIRLPEYLAEVIEPAVFTRQVSGDVIESVQGSVVTVDVTTSAQLSSASVDGQNLPTSGRGFSVPVLSRGDRESRRVEIDWVDQDGLHADVPIRLQVTPIPDRPPSLSVQNDPIPPQVLDSQAVRFQILADDDFRIRVVGMQWSVRENPQSEPVTGEKILGSGASLSAVFQATSLGIPTGETRLRFWVQDDFPDRQRVYSDPVGLNLLTAREHAVWIADRFNRWRQAAMDVRDRELNLYEVNQDLAATRKEERDDDWRNAVTAQARAEAFNGRQLRSLADQGQDLLSQAARNEEVAVQYVEQLAETIASLESMADETMPRVAELLKEAADQEQESKFAELADQESSQGKISGADNDDQATSDADSKNDAERVGLAGTTIVDTSGRKPTDEDPEAEDALELAVEDQAELVEQFKAVADELKQLLGNMEGSTLVKRLKSVSRLQDRVAAQLGRTIEQSFGGSTESNQPLLKSAVADAQDSAARVRTVLDDLEALCQRREIKHFADVLAEMKSAEVLEGIGELETRLVAQPGVSIAAAEFWADNLDRWADDLVDPGSGKPDPGKKNSKSLSPEIVLDVMRILEQEVGLREQTRIAEQGRATMPSGAYMTEAIRLSESQDLLRDRLDQVVDRVEQLPDGELHFASEIEVLGAASDAMSDATKVLVSPETGPAAIAAQTEAIELLLRSNKVNPDSGSGGSGSAGGSDGGDTDQAALAMLARGINRMAQDRESQTELAVGRSRADVPEQWREGLQEYFHLLDRRLPQRDEASP